jgi:hypothetical protein
VVAAKRRPPDHCEKRSAPRRGAQDEKRAREVLGNDGIESNEHETLTIFQMRLKLRFRDLEAGHEGLGVMCEADAVHAIS